MGLLTQILTAPLAPVRGFGWVVNQVIEVAEQEAYDTTPIERQLAELERELLEGRIDEAEFDRREDELLDRIEAIERARSGAPQGQCTEGQEQEEQEQQEEQEEQEEREEQEQQAQQGHHEPER
ncbi:gas vesicle protein GvpG [Streptomyces sp. NPDC056672]|uniref:gas vesicle protein GvpG n=1 Tax=Streptomyces sp. NPDC056672 TaxID=3345906 RepID=UPI00367BE8E7